MDREKRLLLNAKVSNIVGGEILSRPPSISDMQEGQIIIRKMPTGLHLFTRYQGSLHSVKLNKHNMGIADDVSDLQDSSTGTVDNVVSAISGSGADSDINNNFSELTSKINMILNKLSQILKKII